MCMQGMCEYFCYSSVCVCVCACVRVCVCVESAAWCPAVKLQHFSTAYRFKYTETETSFELICGDCSGHQDMMVL